MRRQSTKDNAHLSERHHGEVDLLSLSRNGALCRTWLRMGMANFGEIFGIEGWLRMTWYA